MSTQGSNYKAEPMVYVCGEASLNTPTGGPSLRDIVIKNLVNSWAVRSHPFVDTLEPRLDNMELYQTISHASVFVFIFSKKDS